MWHAFSAQRPARRRQVLLPLQRGLWSLVRGGVEKGVSFHCQTSCSMTRLALCLRSKTLRGACGCVSRRGRRRGAVGVQGGRGVAGRDAYPLGYPRGVNVVACVAGRTRACSSPCGVPSLRGVLRVIVVVLRPLQGVLSRLLRGGIGGGIVSSRCQRSCSAIRIALYLRSEALCGACGRLCGVASVARVAGVPLNLRLSSGVTTCAGR